MDRLSQRCVNDPLPKRLMRLSYSIRHKHRSGSEQDCARIQRYYFYRESIMKNHEFDSENLPTLSIDRHY